MRAGNSLRHAPQDAMVCFLTVGEEIVGSRTCGRFWEQVEHDNVMIYQADSLLCRDAELDIEAFLEFDYVGAPWR